MARKVARPPVSITGVRLDLGGGRRGTDMGPSAVRLAGLHRALRRAGFGDVADLGDIECPGAETADPGSTRAHFLEPIAAACRQVARTVRGILDAGRIPILLGGDHSLAAGSIAGLAAHHRRAGRQVGALWIDAHGDMNTPETSESGNVHGMPLAALLGLGPPELTKIGGSAPALAPDRVALVGIRDLDPAERELVQQSGVGVFTMSDIDQQGIAAVMGEAIRRAQGADGLFHVSFDLDAVDPQYAPGVGTLVEGGLTYREAHLAMELCAAAGGPTSLEMVEINPILDMQNRTGKLAMSLILSALGKFIYRD